MLLLFIVCLRSLITFIFEDARETAPKKINYAKQQNAVVKHHQMQNELQMERPKSGESSNVLTLPHMSKKNNLKTYLLNRVSTFDCTKHYLASPKKYAPFKPLKILNNFRRN